MRIIAFVEPPFRFEPPGEFALLTQMSPSDRFIVVNEREVFFGSNFCPPPSPPLPPPPFNSSTRSIIDAILKFLPIFFCFFFFFSGYQ